MKQLRPLGRAGYILSGDQFMAFCSCTRTKYQYNPNNAYYLAYGTKLNVSGRPKSYKDGDVFKHASRDGGGSSGDRCQSGHELSDGGGYCRKHKTGIFLNAYNSNRE